MGMKAWDFALLSSVSLDALVSPDHFSRHLERSLDLSFVRDLVRDAYAPSGRSSRGRCVGRRLDSECSQRHTPRTCVSTSSVRPGSPPALRSRVRDRVAPQGDPPKFHLDTFLSAAKVQPYPHVPSLRQFPLQHCRSPSRQSPPGGWQSHKPSAPHIRLQQSSVRVHGMSWPLQQIFPRLTLQPPKQQSACEMHDVPALPQPGLRQKAGSIGNSRRHRPSQHCSVSLHPLSVLKQLTSRQVQTVPTQPQRPLWQAASAGQDAPFGRSCGTGTLVPHGAA